nr:GNAT family protein [Pacificimonas pallii]
MEGRFCRVEPIDIEKHAESMFAALAEDETGESWTYMRYGPFADPAEFRHWMENYCLSPDPFFYAFVEKRTGRALGMATYSCISPDHGSIEVGHVSFAPAMQRRAMATEAMYLMARNVFKELDYRRYEWRLDDLNAASHAAARRLGFTYEGVFRNASNYKGRSRDTAWYAMTDMDWGALQGGFEAWLEHLDPESGRQTSSLAYFHDRAGRA